MIKSNQKSQHPENRTSLNMAIKYLTSQPRSIYEMRGYLVKKGFNEDLVNDTIEILLKQKYLDDLSFTRNFVESRVNHKPKSKFALAYELKKKGIEPDVIEDVLKNYNDRDLAIKALDTKIKLWEHLDYKNFNQKIINFLQYRGFSYDISISLLTKLNQSEMKSQNERSK